jgi:Family of unknown function (DUF6364)
MNQGLSKHYKVIPFIIRIFMLINARVMTTKLTLTLDDKVIRQAKRYARAKGRSVSELVESYFKSITEPNSNQSEELTSSVKSLMGSFKAPKNFDYKKILRDEKQYKHE